MSALKSTTVKKYYKWGFDTRLKKHLTDNKIDQLAFSKLVGVSHVTVGYWCTGRRYPHVGTLELLAKALDPLVFYYLITGIRK